MASCRHSDAMVTAWAESWSRLISYLDDAGFNGLGVEEGVIAELNKELAK